jgi:hypothetical protein
MRNRDHSDRSLSADVVNFQARTMQLTTLSSAMTYPLQATLQGAGHGDDDDDDEDGGQSQPGDDDDDDEADDEEAAEGTWQCEPASSQATPSELLNDLR